MSATPGPGPNLETIRARIASLPGVRDVDLDDYPDSLSLRADPADAVALVGEAVRTILRVEAGIDLDVQVELAPSPEGPRPRRSRFDSLHVAQPHPGRMTARAVLEWKGQHFESEMEGEYSSGGELRLAATATLGAIERMTSGAVEFNLIGVKELQVFDHNLVVVLVQSPQITDGNLIGMSIIARDRRHAAALAALNATNRVVGRFVEE